MDFVLDDNAERLQARVRTFLRESHPGRAPKDPEDRRQWEKAWARLLADRGFAGPAWPKEWGGMELSLTEQVAYHEEMTRARVPRQTGGLGIVASTILKFGSAEQRRRYLPLIADAFTGPRPVHAGTGELQNHEQRAAGGTEGRRHDGQHDHALRHHDPG